MNKLNKVLLAIFIILTIGTFGFLVNPPLPWHVSRASAIAAYLLLTLLIISGISIKTSLVFRFVSPTVAWVYHRLIGKALGLAVLVHISSLYFDAYSNFKIVDLLIPYSSSFKPLYLSMGIFGFYLLVFVIISSIYFIDKHPKLWKSLHCFTYLIFALVTVHGFFIGTDSSLPLMKLMYLSSGILVSVFAVYRAYFFYRQVK